MALDRACGGGAANGRAGVSPVIKPVVDVRVMEYRRRYLAARPTLALAATAGALEKAGRPTARPVGKEGQPVCKAGGRLLKNTAAVGRPAARLVEACEGAVRPA